MSARCRRPSRSTKISSVPLTMISVTVGSASSGSSTPRPIASSITWRIRRVRSAVVSTGPSRLTMRPTTRSSRARRCGSESVGELGEVDLLEQPAAVVGDAVVAAGDAVAIGGDAVAQAHVSSGSVALRVTEKPSAVTPGRMIGILQVHGGRLPVSAEVVEAVAQRTRDARCGRPSRGRRRGARRRGWRCGPSSSPG